MRIAITSQNFRTITGHAGKARRFMVFETAGDGGLFQAGSIDLPRTMSIHEHPSNLPHPIDGIDVLVTSGCGDGFRRKMAARGIEVVTTAEADPLAAAAAVAEGRALPPAASHEDEHECTCGAGQGHGHIH